MSITEYANLEEQSIAKSKGWKLKPDEFSPALKLEAGYFFALCFSFEQW